MTNHVATQIQVTASYLPSPNQFRGDFARSTVLAEVRTSIMQFFQVQDRTEGRKNYTYYLSFEGRRIDNLQTTVDALVGNERHAAHFQLVEQIQEG
jgi:hypothetical protein